MAHGNIHSFPSGDCGHRGWYDSPQSVSALTVTQLLTGSPIHMP